MNVPPMTTQCLGTMAQQSLLLVALSTSDLTALPQQMTPTERPAVLRATMAASQAVLRQYEWIETTVTTLKDEEKSRKQQRCYYGADGKVQKVLLNESAPEPKKRGLRGRIAEKKK